MDSIIEQMAKIIAHECVDPMYNLPYSTRYISFSWNQTLFATEYYFHEFSFTFQPVGEKIRQSLQKQCQFTYKSRWRCQNPMLENFVNFEWWFANN